MHKKLSQNLVIAVNAISFGGAAIFGGIGIFAAIANFTKGSWYIYGYGIESLVSVIATSFFLAVLALLLALLAKFTIKKINNADLLKKTYETLAVVTLILTTLFVAIALSVAIYALIGVGSKSIDQKELWLNGFLPALIAAVVTGTVAFIGKKVAKGKIAILPLATNIVLGIASVSLLLMIVSTVVEIYGKSSSQKANDLYNDLYNWLY